MDPLLLAVPIFLLFMGAEAWALARRGERGYRLADFASAISCALLDQLGILVAGAAFIAFYTQVQTRWGLVHVSPASPLAFAACVLAHDLAYYAYHRASHRVNVLWAAHAVHHQSEEYALHVSFRQGAIATFVTWAFYLPLAFAGFPARMFLIVHGAYQIYQFFVHTRLIGKLGPLEAIFATPSHHRVHHGKDQGFLDKNYGGFFIAWDRLFDTFTEETHEPTYGVPRGIRSWSPFWANLHPFRELWERSANAPTIGGKIAVWLAPPEHTFDWEKPARESSGYDETAPVELSGYLVVALVVSSLVLMGTAYTWSSLSPWVARGLVAFTWAALASTMAFFDRKHWALPLERVRLGAGLVGFLAAAFLTKTFFPAIVAIACGVSLAMLIGSTPGKMPKPKIRI